MVPKAILFDLDDTIISFDGVSEEALEFVCRLFLEQNQTAFDLETVMSSIRKIREWFWSDPQRHRIGRLDLNNTRREVFWQALRHINFNDREKSYALADQYSSYHKKLIHLLPNAVETLESLKLSGIRLGLVTNGASSEQRSKIERFNLEKYFEFCLVEEEVGFGKPDLRVYERAMSLLNISAPEVWMVGDNLNWDVEAPKKLGIYSIWVNVREKELSESMICIPDKIIKSIAEIPTLLNNEFSLKV